MNELILWEWDKKERTMRRYIKSGDIFCFQYNEDTYCFGRIISRLDIGTPAEIFDYVSGIPTISKEIIDNASRMFHPININVYALFDRKAMGEWRIIGHCNNFKPSNVDDIFFTFGIAPCKKIDVHGNETIITQGEAKDIPKLIFLSDNDIKELVKSKLKKDYINHSQISAEETIDVDIKEEIKPFILSESTYNVSLLLNVGSYKNHLFQVLFKNEFRGNGYDWTSLAKIFLKEKLPHLKASIQFDPEADMFCAYSENKKAIFEFAVAFHAMCEEENLMKELLARANLD